MRRFTFALITSLMMTGCFHLEVAADSNQLDNSKPEVQRQLPYWAGGIGHQHVDVAAACKGKGKFSQFQFKRRFLDEFLQVVTIGIYSPMTGNILCNGK